MTELGLSGWAARLRLDKYSAVYLLIAFFIFFGLTEGDTFLTWTSTRLVLTEKAIVGVLALAFLIPLAADTFDLSIGAVMSFSLVIVNSLALNTDIPTGVAAVIAIAACAVVGFVSGFIVVRLGVNSFIATLGMSQVVSGIILAISDNRQITRAIGDTYRDFGRTNVFGLPLYFWYMILLAIVLWYVLEHTPLGRYLFATGGNREAARLSGISTDTLTWASLVVSAVIAGFAGIIWSWKVGTFSNSVGPGFLFPAVAAVFFGASQLRGRANVWGTLLAVYALAFGVKGLQLRFSTNTFWIEPLFEGVTLIIAVAIAARKGIIKVKRRDRTPTDLAIEPDAP
ncbi:MAG: ABC transporter permease [Acidimicrobiales bacterium]|nr:ABC transporter permease [Acidimicrobiales bacterium]